MNLLERLDRVVEPAEPHPSRRQPDTDPGIAGAQRVGSLEIRGGFAKPAPTQIELAQPGQGLGVGRALGEELAIDALRLAEPAERDQRGLVA